VLDLCPSPDLSLEPVHLLVGIADRVSVQGLDLIACLVPDLVDGSSRPHTHRHKHKQPQDN
jgi:hypothetical protein